MKQWVSKGCAVTVMVVVMVVGRGDDGEGRGTNFPIFKLQRLECRLQRILII